MERNWYAVYTKPQKEQKISAILNKKGIENFCPAINIIKGKGGNKKVVTAPLFDAYIFVLVYEKDLSSIKNIMGVMNVLYWKNRPAVINHEEINALKSLDATYTKIKIDRILVNQSGGLVIKDEPHIAFNEKTVSVKQQLVKINLPSLGYRIIAERAFENENFIEQEVGILARFPKRINAFFFN